MCHLSCDEPAQTPCVCQTRDVSMKSFLSAGARPRGLLLTLLVLVLLMALPLAVWLDLRNITESSLRRQASDLSSVITGIRGYYASHIVARVLASPGST